MRKESPVPEGWFAALKDTADLEASFLQLGTAEHFHLETLRGFTRFLQLRFADASRHYEQAHLLARDEPRTPQNIIRLFLLHCYEFENALTESPFVFEGHVQLRSVPDLAASVIQEFPEIELVLRIRLTIVGIFHLHAGRAEEARAAFGRLLQTEPPMDTKSTVSLGLAAAHHNLGFERESRRDLEDAGLYVQTGCSTLGRARACGILYAFHSYLGEETEARDWLLFLQQLACPQATKDVFLKRGQRLLRRVIQAGRLTVV